MRIAAAYENGEIYQHFGRTEQFKIYETADDRILSSEVIGSNGIGHGALAGLLAEHAVDVLICGGLGAGAQNALAEAGILVISGTSGSADEAVQAYLRGELQSAGATCDHHHDEEHACSNHGCGDDCGGDCGDDCEGGCGDGCGGGCGGGRRLPVTLTGPNAGKKCSVHYTGTFNDGTPFDSSYDRGKPLTFVCGVGMMIRGFDAAVAEMEIGEIKDVHLMPEEAYGPADPDAVITIDVSRMPGSETLQVGQRIYLQNALGQPFPVTVTAREGSTITLDANHEMAGKELNFRIELVSVEG